MQGLVIQFAGTFHSVLGQKMSLSEHPQRILVFPKQKKSSNNLRTDFETTSYWKLSVRSPARVEEGAGLAFLLTLKRILGHEKEEMPENLAFCEIR